MRGTVRRRIDADGDRQPLLGRVEQGWELVFFPDWRARHFHGYTVRMPVPRRRFAFARARLDAERRFERADLSARGGDSAPEYLRRGPRWILERGTEFPAGAAAGTSLAGMVVYVVPNFISSGYFTEQVIPRELGLDGTDLRKSSDAGGPHYCQPVGLSGETMTGVLAQAGAREVVAALAGGRSTRHTDVPLHLRPRYIAKRQLDPKIIHDQAEIDPRERHLCRLPGRS